MTTSATTRRPVGRPGVRSAGFGHEPSAIGASRNGGDHRQQPLDAVQDPESARDQTGGVWKDRELRIRQAGEASHDPVPTRSDKLDGVASGAHLALLRQTRPAGSPRNRQKFKSLPLRPATSCRHALGTWERARARHADRRPRLVQDERLSRLTGTPPSTWKRRSGRSLLGTARAGGGALRLAT
jgi:hypothetical protein